MFHPFTLMALLAIAVSVPAYAQEREDPVWHQDAATAWKLAQKKQRPFVLYIGTANCPYCRMMERTLQDREVLREMRRSFIGAAIDAEDEPRLVRMLRVEGFPSTFVVNPDGQVESAIVGYVAPDRLRQALSEIVESGNARQIGD